MTIGRIGPDGFTLDQVMTLFAELDAELQRTHYTADLYVIGGVAVAFHVNEARMTQDIDAALSTFSDGGRGSETTAPIRAAIRKVAQHNGLDDGWVNDSAGGMIPHVQDDNYRTVYSSRSLHVRIAGSEILLAMKCMAARPKDIDDLRRLAKHLELDTPDAVLATARRIMKVDHLPPDREEWVRGVLVHPPGNSM